MEAWNGTRKRVESYLVKTGAVFMREMETGGLDVLGWKEVDRGSFEDLTVIGIATCLKSDAPMSDSCETFYPPQKIFPM